MVRPRSLCECSWAQRCVWCCGVSMLVAPVAVVTVLCRSVSLPALQCFGRSPVSPPSQCCVRRVHAEQHFHAHHATRQVSAGVINVFGTWWQVSTSVSAGVRSGMDLSDCPAEVPG